MPEVEEVAVKATVEVVEDPTGEVDSAVVVVDVEQLMMIVIKKMMQLVKSLVQMEMPEMTVKEAVVGDIEEAIEGTEEVVADLVGLQSLNSLMTEERQDKEMLMINLGKEKEDFRTDALVSKGGGGLKVTVVIIAEILAVMENRKPQGMRMIVADVLRDKDSVPTLMLWYLLVPSLAAYA